MTQTLILVLGMCALSTILQFEVEGDLVKYARNRVVCKKVCLFLSVNLCIRTYHGKIKHREKMLNQKPIMNYWFILSCKDLISRLYHQLLKYFKKSLFWLFFPLPSLPFSIQFWKYNNSWRNIMLQCLEPSPFTKEFDQMKHTKKKQKMRYLRLIDEIWNDNTKKNVNQKTINVEKNADTRRNDKQFIKKDVGKTKAIDIEKVWKTQRMNIQLAERSYERRRPFLFWSELVTSLLRKGF